MKTLSVVWAVLMIVLEWVAVILVLGLGYAGFYQYLHY